MSGMDLAALQAWCGREERREVVLDPWPAAALAAALGRDDLPGPGDPLPPFWHLLYHLPVAHAAATGPDGHPARGGFLPPVPLPRRMWAGGRLAVEQPLRLGERVEKISTVKAVTPKNGRQGPLVFVLVEHRLAGPAGPALVEEHDIVYREAPAPGGRPARVAPPAGAVWRQCWRPDEVLLFRYSALTYNGHRIHYDHRYATEVENYPGLVVHGPLLATLMLELLRREMPGMNLRRFAYRAVAPLTVGNPLTVCGCPRGDGRTIELWVEGAAGELAMQGEVVPG